VHAKYRGSQIHHFALVFSITNPAQKSWVVHYPAAYFFVNFIYLEKC